MLSVFLTTRILAFGFLAYSGFSPFQNFNFQNFGCQNFDFWDFSSIRITFKILDFSILACHNFNLFGTTNPIMVLTHAKFLLQRFNLSKYSPRLKKKLLKKVVKKLSLIKLSNFIPFDRKFKTIFPILKLKTEKWG